MLSDKLSHVLSRGCRCFNLYITKAAWNYCVLLLWILRYLVTQTSHGECYSFVFLLYNRPCINYLRCAMLPDCTVLEFLFLCSDILFLRWKIFIHGSVIIILSKILTNLIKLLDQAMRVGLYKTQTVTHR